MREALFVLASAFRPQARCPLLCKKCELSKLQGIVEDLKRCWKNICELILKSLQMVPLKQWGTPYQ